MQGPEGTPQLSPKLIMATCGVTQMEDGEVGAKLEDVAFWMDGELGRPVPRLQVLTLLHEAMRKKLVVAKGHSDGLRYRSTERGRLVVEEALKRD